MPWGDLRGWRMRNTRGYVWILLWRRSIERRPKRPELLRLHVLFWCGFGTLKVTHLDFAEIWATSKLFTIQQNPPRLGICVRAQAVGLNLKRQVISKRFARQKAVQFARINTGILLIQASGTTRLASVPQMPHGWGSKPEKGNRSGLDMVPTMTTHFQAVD